MSDNESLRKIRELQWERHGISGKDNEKRRPDQFNTQKTYQRQNKNKVGGKGSTVT